MNVNAEKILQSQAESLDEKYRMAICLYVPMIVFIIIALVRNTLIQNLSMVTKRYYYTIGLEDEKEMEKD